MPTETPDSDWNALECQETEDHRENYWLCECGRHMTVIFADSPGGDWELYWCAGCGTVHIHYADNSGDSRYIPDPKFKGVP